jgi:glycosyltransferase involved in cell wall biosynthesis
VRAEPRRHAPRRPPHERPWSYAAAATEQPQVTVVVDASDAGAEDVRRTARSLRHQSLRTFRCIVTGSNTLPGGFDEAVGGERVGLVSREGLGSTLAAEGTPFVAFVSPGEELEPTALEKWLWILDTHPGIDGVNGLRAIEDGETWAVDERAASSAALMRRRACDGHGVGAPLVATMPEVAVWDKEGRTVLPPIVPLWSPADVPNDFLHAGAPCANRLEKRGRHLVLVSPFMAVGGADRFNLQLIDELLERGWTVTVATTLPGNDEWVAEYAERTPDLFAMAAFVPLLDQPRFLQYLVESRRADAVLVSNSELGYRLLPFLRSVCPDVALLDYCHSDIARWNAGGYPRFSVAYAGFLDLTITASEYLRTWMIAHGAEQDAIETCYVGTDADVVRPDAEARRLVRDRFGVPDGAAIVLFVGRLDEDKQPHVLVEALRHVAGQRQDFVVLVVGDGPSREQLRLAVRRLRLKRTIRILGAVDPGDVRELMAAADIFFLPSLWEGIALTLYEAMAAGSAVVAADVGGQRELVTADCGVLVRRATPENEALHYAAAILELLEHRDERAALGAAARARVEAGFRVDQMGERMTRLLELALERRSREQPRAPASWGGLAAVEAIEVTRLQREVDDTWRRLGPVVSLSNVGWKAALYVSLRVALGPAYRWSVRHGFGLGPRIAAGFKSSVLR